MTARNMRVSRLSTCFSISSRRSSSRAERLIHALSTRVRRAISLLGTVAAIGAVVAVVVAYRQVGDQLHDELARVGVTNADIGHTTWFWVAAGASVVAVIAAVLGVVWTPAWPEMGRRYDAPGAAPETPAPPEEQTNLDLWKAMDEGRDPTA